MIPTAESDQISVQLDEKLAQLSRTHFECYIYKVHEPVRRQGNKTYEPEMLAIGPYHRGKAKLKVMEEHKLLYLQQLLERRNEISVVRYVSAMRDLQERARRCYAEDVSLSEDEFVEMMILDGCFIIELFRKFTMTSMRDEHDPLFKMDWIHHRLWRDLVLFENQLPFFVLADLFNMSKVSDPRDNIIHLAIRYYCWTRDHYYYTTSQGPEIFLEASIGISAYDVRHLLALLHRFGTTSFAGLVLQKNGRKKQKRWQFILSATELHEAGIKFKKANHDTPLFHVKFKNGELEIPQFSIVDMTESFFRNLIAYEQYLQDCSPKYITDYFTFLICLINSSKDVTLLRQYGILNTPEIS